MILHTPHGETAHVKFHEKCLSCFLCGTVLETIFDRCEVDFAVDLGDLLATFRGRCDLVIFTTSLLRKLGVCCSEGDMFCTCWETPLPMSVNELNESKISLSSRCSRKHFIKLIKGFLIIFFYSYSFYILIFTDY